MKIDFSREKYDLTDIVINQKKFFVSIKKELAREENARYDLPGTKSLVRINPR